MHEDTVVADKNIHFGPDVYGLRIALTGVSFGACYAAPKKTQTERSHQQ